jgi:hypothetical protein
MALFRVPTVATAVLLLPALLAVLPHTASADEPKPKPENTISVSVGEPVTPQKFDRPVKFWVADVTDRSGNPQPLLVLKERGGIFLDKLPTLIVKDSLEQSLRSAGMLAADQASADLILRVYLFHFGLASGSGLDLFGKVEFSTMVKNPKNSESVEVKSAGTSIAKGAVRKKNIQKNVQEDIEDALHDATRSFLRGTQLKEAVAALNKPADSAAPPPSAPGSGSDAAKPPAAVAGNPQNLAGRYFSFTPYVDRSCARERSKS